LSHPDDATLLALVRGEDLAAEMHDHVRGCAACSSAVDAFRVVVSSAERAPAPFASVRMRRMLDKSLDGELRAQRSRWRPAHVATAMACAAIAGACVAAISTGAWDRVAQTAAAARPPHVGDDVVSVQSDARIREGDALARSGHAEQAARLYVSALDGSWSDLAAERLRALVVGMGDAEAEALVAHWLRELDRSVGRKRGQAAMRLRCEWALLFRGDRTAVEMCQAFAREHPADPAVQRLAFATGKLAEERLRDPTLAVAEYTRALLGSAAVPTSDALFSRARCRADLGDVAEARADLRLYLHLDPRARERAEVQALVERLAL
jgi:hypothetical protein